MFFYLTVIVFLIFYFSLWILQNSAKTFFTLEKAKKEIWKKTLLQLLHYFQLSTEQK